MAVLAIHSALSGLAAEATRIRVSAHNVANLNTDGFEASSVVLESRRSGGVRVAKIETSGTPGPVVTDGSEIRRLSNVSLEGEIVTEITARVGYSANLRVLKTADEMVGSLFDVTV